MTKSGQWLKRLLKAICAIGILWVLFDILFTGYRTTFERVLILVVALFSFALAWLVERLDGITVGKSQPGQDAPQDKPQE